MGLFTDILSNVSSTTVLLGITVFLISYWFMKKDRRNLPPSPNVCLPILGHMYYMQSDMRKMLRNLRGKLGDVYTLRLGSQLAIFIGGYKTVHEAFVKNADVFSERPTLLTMTTMSRNKGFVTKNGQEWREHRSFVLSTLKDLGMGRRVLETRIIKEANRLVEAIRKYEEKPFVVRPLANVIVSNVMTSMLFGETFDADDSLITGILDKIEMNISNMPFTGILDFIPFLHWLPGDIFKLELMKRNIEDIHGFCEEIVRKHQGSPNNGETNDLTSAYLKVLKEREGNTTLSVDNLVGTMNDLITAGSETTATSIAWSIACMVNFPEIQNKLHQVIADNIAVGTAPSMADKSKLAYVEAFYMEVLRYCNLLLLTPIHAVSKDTELNGYTIPTDAVIYVDMDSVAMDPDIWGDPENFRPERFLDEDGKLLKKEEFIIFFFGKRSCVGESLARMELFLILSILVQNFEFASPGNEQLTVESVDGIFGFTHAPNPFNVIAKPRKGKTST